MEGAISLAVDTVNEIETKGITMSDTDKSRLVTNILTVSVVCFFFFFYFYFSIFYINLFLLFLLILLFF